MNDSTIQPEPRPDVLRALRLLASRGSTVRELVREVQARLGYTDKVYVPVLWYFTQAFHLSLPEVLPIREWIGTFQDQEIDAQVLPAIERTRDRWMSNLVPGYNGSAGTAVANPGVVTSEPRS